MTDIDRVQRSLAQVAGHFAEHPQAALSRDTPAVAVLEGGLRCRATGPAGASVVSDMPAAVGGDGSAPSPGWLLRAALANCDATVIAMRAAQMGIALDRLEVTVGSDSDDRGLLGLAESSPAGPLAMQVQVRLSARGASRDQLQAIVHWAERHSPVSDAVRRTIPVTTELIVD